MCARVRIPGCRATLAIVMLLCIKAEAAERLYIQNQARPYGADSNEGSMLGRLGGGTADMMGGGNIGGGLPSSYIPGQQQNSKYRAKPTGDPIADLSRVVAKINENAEDCYVPIESRARPTHPSGELIASDPSQACIDMYHVLHKATGKVGKYPRQACKALRPLITAPYMDLVTHRVITTCTGMMDGLDPNGKDTKNDQLAWLRVLNILMKVPAMKAYWESIDAPQTYAMWANLLNKVGDLKGSEQMFGLASEGCMLTGDEKQARMELNSAITSMSRNGRADEAQIFFNKMISLRTPQDKKIVYRTMWQRSAFFLPFLSGDPFPFERPVEGEGSLPDGCPTPTIKAIQDNWPAILDEFKAIVATPEEEEVPEEEAKDAVDTLDLGLSDEASLFAGILNEVKEMHERPKGKVGFANPFTGDSAIVKGTKDGWQHFILATGGKWDTSKDGHCSKMPTVCRLLMSDHAVSGRIPLEKVDKVNEAGGYQPPEELNHWVHPDYRNKKTMIDESEFVENGAGYIADQAVAILKLKPGATIIDHVGPSNSRFNIQFGFQVPKGAHLKAGNITRAVPLGPDFIVFDESFEHTAWNQNADTTRYILQLHTWHPALMPLVEPPLWEMEEDPLTHRGNNSPKTTDDLFTPDVAAKLKSEEQDSQKSADGKEEEPKKSVHSEL